ncbi:hypothetical protein K523DRAFT_396052, partial [Schizophyllum commune Tattone D]
VREGRPPAWRRREIPGATCLPPWRLDLPLRRQRTPPWRRNALTAAHRTEPGSPPQRRIRGGSAACVLRPSTLLRPTPPRRPSLPPQRRPLPPRRRLTASHACRQALLPL